MIPEAYSVNDKVTIITGGGTGIGKHIALRFAESGAPVVIASRSLEHLEPVKKEIESAGGQALALQCDVRDPDQVQAVVDATVSEFGRVDVMVNNHGASFRCDILDMSPNGWNSIVGINLTGTFLFCRAAGRAMRDQGGGTIVNISSTAGTHGAPAMAHYAAAKAGVINFTTSLADELAPHNIRVNCVTPGPIITEGFLEVLDARLAESTFLAGERPTLADCTLAAAFGFARFGQVEIDPGFANLARWSAEFEARPSVRNL